MSITVKPTTVYRASEGQRFSGDTDLTVVECSTCHVTYAIPTSFYNSALRWRGDRADGRGWKICCPFGHTWWYIGESEEERLERQLQCQRDRAGLLAAERDQAQASARAQRGAATRARNERDRIRRRMANGVCPCCGRTFKQVARHMRSQHPDFVIEAHTAVS
jgi:hypothetical protein